MIQYWGSAAVAAAILMLSVTSQAKEPEAQLSVWTGCGDNPISGTTKFMMGPTAARYLTSKAKPSEGVERCTAALDDLGPEAQAVIAAQVAGRPDIAEMWLTKAQEGINTPHEATRFERDFNIATQPSEQIAELDKWTGLIEAAAFVGKGDAEGAAQKLETMTRMPFSQTTLALFRTVISKLPPESHPNLKSLLAQVEEQFQLDSNEQYVSQFDPAKLLDEVPDHEDVMLANPYQTAVKFLRANGFSVKVAKDGKTADVGFFGNKSHPFAIGEMALLRAADLAASQGKTAFRIVSNNDFVQTSTMTMYGVEVGPTTVAGHSTRLKIEFVDPGTSQKAAGIIETVDIQMALTPIYVKAEKK